MKNILYILRIVPVVFSFSSFCQNVPLDHYEGYYLKTGTYPEDVNNWWMSNGYEVQGVTHDDDNWYFTLTDKDRDNGVLWRIPRSVPLASPSQPTDTGIKVVTMNDVDTLSEIFKWHWGDPDCFRYNGVDYILIPIPGPMVACFKADNLEYVNYANLDSNVQDYAGWCAVGKDGCLYTSSNHAWGIVKYKINWDSLIGSPGNHDACTYIDSFPFQDSNGSPMQLFHMQGGEFTPSGELLYLVCGSAGCDALGPIWDTFGPGEPMPSDGIHVFETINWKELTRSVNSSDSSTNFSYVFDNDCTCYVPIPLPPLFIPVPVPFGSQTPEGLTIWDLEDGSAPYISGQLHVIKDHYNTAFCDDAITMQHYSEKIYIDKNNLDYDSLSIALKGTKEKPFRTVAEAYNYYPIWDGAQMIIISGSYPEPVFFNRRVRITSQNGIVTLGH
ncbi:MAG: hypothetical protein U0U46_13095 [Saprospiraceae bacterium]